MDNNVLQHLHDERWLSGLCSVFPNTAGVLFTEDVLNCAPDRFTARIVELMKVLKDLNAGKYERTMVSQQEKGTHES